MLKKKKISFIIFLVYITFTILLFYVHMILKVRFKVEHYIWDVSLFMIFCWLIEAVSSPLHCFSVLISKSIEISVCLFKFLFKFILSSMAFFNFVPSYLFSFMWILE